MSFELTSIDLAAEQIAAKLKSGELTEGCSMAILFSPVTEAWDKAQALATTAELSAEQQQHLLACLDQQTRQHFEATRYEDFDLIYERLLQLVSNMRKKTDSNK
jgi:hypothetical protein